MDHRNADGSHAEMCGNGIRLFLHVLVTEGLLDRAACEAGVLVGTRGGPRRVGAAPDGGYWVDMGPARPFGRGEATWAGRRSPGWAVSMGNPHLACLTDVDVDTLDLAGAPGVDPGPVPGRRERRVGQRPRARRAHPAAGLRARCGGDPLVRHRSLRGRVRRARGRRRATGDGSVDVPGGRLSVQVTRRRRCSPGPAVVVSAGVLCPEWLAG